MLHILCVALDGTWYLISPITQQNAVHKDKLTTFKYFLDIESLLPISDT
jgi:hypothetical protein